MIHFLRGALSFRHWRPRFLLLTMLTLAAFGCGESVPDVAGIEVELNADNFDHEVLEYDGSVLVEFGAAWCGPCRMMDPVLAYLSEQYRGRLKVGRVDVDVSPILASEYEGLDVLPTFVMFRDGEVVGLGRGSVSYRVLSGWVDEHLAE